ncbi:endolytic transglycosylase MltG [Halodesulfovibrio sp. MK-HDV]|jgi:peptidoglycan lytic transglycosylase G|uniref:endolytic transglycosylase MltG n=1 Tax=Halodesulfovibrio sp. MK-HDV TaxID=2599925 RepID=UPI00136BEC3A|nr:endolytic transglycosylase MltG [Halodesulfovibrio sp. MK-HDV]KAF1074417.1 Endolytic murein transglycosylase [Halodesulfovibrio sp. MK-HDV]
MGTFSKIISALLVLTVLVAAGVWFTFETYTRSPMQKELRQIPLVVPAGASFNQIIDDMARQGALTHPYAFRLLVRLRKQQQNLKAGEYLLNTGWTPERLLKELVTGKGILYTLTFQEGLPWWVIAKKIEQQGFAKVEDFSRVIHDPEFLKKHNIPFPDAEGFLFPETYKLSKPREMNEASAEDVASMLVHMFWQKTAPLWGDSRPSPEVLKKIIILASLVEKETGVPEERERVSGVYENRLEMGMRMQADPTIIYGLGKSFDGDIRRTDIRNKKNKYNTYQHRGLPPGPICSPGLEAIKAALNPEQHKYLFFVSKGDGSHKFSKTLKEHNNAVRKYQLRRKK